jgi:hypothetical protein
MSTIVTRSGKGSPLTHVEVDANFTNLNSDKTENATAAITGGTIDNTVIGGTTPAAGTFTTLTSNGATTFTNGSAIFSIDDGGSLSPQQMRLIGPSTTLGRNRIFSPAQLRISAGSTNPIQFHTAAGTNVNSDGNVQLAITNTASAVNYVQVTGAATGNSAGPTISAQGSDSNVPLAIQSKLASPINFYTSGGFQQFRINNTASAVNFLQVTGGAAGVAPVLSAQGSDTNIPAVVQPKGTGALQAQQTDSTATGGNARGANAVDWQTARDAASRVASGQYSVVTGGYANTASGTASLSGGFLNNNSGNFSFLGGGAGQNLAGSYAVIAGGWANTASGFINFIGGGYGNSGTSGSAVTTQSGTMNATTAVTLSGSNANIKVGQYISGTSISNGTYVAAISGTSLTLSQAASGSSTSTLSFYTPHGVVVGGGNNQATGSYSFIGGGGDAGTAANRNVASGDWSVVVGGRVNQATGIASFVGGGGFEGSNLGTNLASGTCSSVMGGFQNTASGVGSAVTGGFQNIANSTQSTCVGGRRATTRSIIGNTVFSASENPIADAQGVSQTALLLLATQTTDATATVLRSNSSAASTTNQVILPNNSAYFFKGEVVAGVTGGGNTKGWTIEGVIKRGANAASTALVGTPTVTSSYADAGASTWALTATADTTNGGLKITFTGQASTTIRCVAKIETTEMTF